MSTAFIPSATYWTFKAKTRPMTNSGKRSVVSGFPGAQKVDPHFWMSDPSRPVGLTVYFDGAGQPAVLEARNKINEGLYITVIAKNISDTLARDFVLVGASVNLIDFNTRAIRLYNLIKDGIIVHVILDDKSGYGRVSDLKKEERAAKDKGGKGSCKIYVLGNFGSPTVAKVDGNGTPFKKGVGKRDDIISAGGIPVDMERFRKCGIGPRILTFAL